MKRTTTFHLHEAGPAPRLTVVGKRTVRTIEGKLTGSVLTRAGPVAAAYVLLVTLGELGTLYDPRLGIALHGATLLALTTHAALTRRVAPGLAAMLIAVAPASLIRIVSLTSPLAQFSYVQWFMILALIIYAGLVTAIKILKPRLSDLGLRMPEARHIPLELTVIAAGALFGWIEYQILEPGALVADLRVRSVLAPVIVLYVSTGLLEELLFRGLMQRYSIGALGRWAGIGFVTLVFAVLHTGWNSWLDVLFVAAVGGIYSLVVLRTKSIIGVSISHGVTNSVLFLVMPLTQV